MTDLPLEPEESPPPESDLSNTSLPVRHRLPDTRPSVVHKFNINGHEGYITVGFFEDGTPGELFLKMAVTERPNRAIDRRLKQGH